MCARANVRMLRGEPLAKKQLIQLMAFQSYTEIQAARHAVLHAASLVDKGDEARVEIDRVLGGVIGSHDGKLFRSFAQSLTLDALLAVANSHLDELAPRYQLERIPRHDLEIQVIDRDLGAEVRSVQSLSGGESFLASLALAVGLSELASGRTAIESLFIDEGFGSLDPTTLETAMAALEGLQTNGKTIGVISHVDAMKERISTQIQVRKRDGGRSTLEVKS